MKKAINHGYDAAKLHALNDKGSDVLRYVHCVTSDKGKTIYASDGKRLYAYGPAQAVGSKYTSVDGEVDPDIIPDFEKFFLPYGYGVADSKIEEGKLKTRKGRLSLKSDTVVAMTDAHAAAQKGVKKDERNKALILSRAENGVIKAAAYCGLDFFVNHANIGVYEGINVALPAHKTYGDVIASINGAFLSDAGKLFGGFSTVADYFGSEEPIILTEGDGNTLARLLILPMRLP